jgi:hypothetical protein
LTAANNSAPELNGGEQAAAAEGCFSFARVALAGAGLIGLPDTPRCDSAGLLPNAPVMFGVRASSVSRALVVSESFMDGCG